MGVYRMIYGIRRALVRGAWAFVLAGLVAAPAVQAQNSPNISPDIISPFDATLIESLISPRALIGEVVTERDLDLLFAHLKASIVAASAGTEAPPLPDELKQRADAIGRALRARGSVAAMVLLDALEAGARQRLREMQRQRAAPAASAGTPGAI